MPSGYTAPVQDGTVTTVSEFAAQCARGFGAFIHQRDDGNTSLKRPVFNEYYEESYNQALDALHTWNNRTEEQKYAEWSEYYNERLVAKHESHAKILSQRVRYESMLAKLRSIDPPASHVEFHNFMISQITDSIKHDCSSVDSDWYTPREYVEWCENKSERVNSDVEYYGKCLNDAIERHNHANAWIDTLGEVYGVEVSG